MSDTIRVTSLCTRSRVQIFLLFIGFWRHTTLFQRRKALIPSMPFVSSHSCFTISNHTTMYRSWFSPPAANQLLLTKGDNNHVDDIEWYRGMDWLERRHIVGKVRG